MLRLPSWKTAADMVERNPAAAVMLASEAVRQMLHFAFLKAGRFIPRDKDVLDTLMTMDPDLATKARLFFDSVDWKRRIHLANELADHILEVRGSSSGIARLKKCLSLQHKGKRTGNRHLGDLNQDSVN
jgi:hypothetical protein